MHTCITKKIDYSNRFNKFNSTLYLIFIKQTFYAFNSDFIPVHNAESAFTSDNMNRNYILS